jgi:hypothetical protein
MFWTRFVHTIVVGKGIKRANPIEICAISVPSSQHRRSRKRHTRTAGEQDHESQWIR